MKRGKETKQLSRTAKVELQRLNDLIRKLLLSARNIRKVRRVVHVWFQDTE